MKYERIGVIMQRERIKAQKEARIELIDNWSRKWPAVLELVDRLDQRKNLVIDEDGWLSARQNLLVAFAAGEPAAFICFRVQPIVRPSGVLTGADGRAACEAVVEAQGVDPAFDEVLLAHKLRVAAMNRALELGCKKFVSRTGIHV